MIYEEVRCNHLRFSSESRGDSMLMRQVDLRMTAPRPFPISYLIQTANQFACDIFVTSEAETANVKSYDEIKRIRMCAGPLTFYFKGSDEGEAGDRIQRFFTAG